MSKHTKKISTRRKQRIKNILIKQVIDKFISGEIESDQIFCYWCKEPIDEDQITIDHLKELNNGGSWYNINNIVLSCSECNNLRSNAPEKFKEKLHDLNI